MAQRFSQLRFHRSGFSPLRFASLPATKTLPPPPSPYEDLFEYTLVDPFDHITVAGERAIGSDWLSAGHSAQLYKDFGADYFDPGCGWEIRFEIRVTNVDDLEYVEEAPALCVLRNNTSALVDDHGNLGIVYVQLYVYHEGEEDSISLSANGARNGWTQEFGDSVDIDKDVTYYCSWKYGPGEGQITLQVYSDENRSVLVGVSSFIHSGYASLKYRYHQAIGKMWDSGGAMGFWIERVEVKAT